MYEIVQKIADLNEEIGMLEASLLTTTNHDARRWITACLNVCLREHAQLAAQFRSAAIACLDEPLHERSMGETEPAHSSTVIPVS
jgi:hypothetical protein